MMEMAIVNREILAWGLTGIAGLLLIIGIVVAIVKKVRPRKLKTQYYVEKWKKLQSQLVDSKLWPLAIIDADKLLDEALLAKGYRGKTMGERLVSAQRDIANNDLVWFAHKLRNRLVNEPDIKVTKTDVKDALIGLRNALKDLGAFDAKS